MSEMNETQHNDTATSGNYAQSDLGDLYRQTFQPEAYRKAWVFASPEILEELLRDWSRPVQARATENPDGSWDMTFRTYPDDLRKPGLEYLDRVAEAAREAGRRLEDGDWTQALIVLKDAFAAERF